jgi:hypothetical protein
LGRAVAQLVEALRYKPEGREFNSRWCHFSWKYPFGRAMALGPTQPLTEMSKRGRCIGLKTLPPSSARFSINLGASTSCKPQGLLRPVMGLLYLTYLLYPILKSSSATCSNFISSVLKVARHKKKLVSKII